MHIIKFGQVNNNPEYMGRVTNRFNLEKYLKLGYEIVKTPVMVDNRASFNQNTTPESKDLDYLLEIPTKTYNEGQKTKQLQNDLLTYDTTGSIGKDLNKFMEPQLERERLEVFRDTTIFKFIKYKFTKKLPKKKYVDLYYKE